MPEIALTRPTNHSVPNASAKPAKEGSPWTGMWSVVVKEMADHLSSTRMIILEILILLAAVGTVYVASKNIGQNASSTQFLYLSLFTTSSDPLPSFIELASFFIPLVSIALTFDAVNGEFNRHTISRILAQPIYRDALLLGKFLASLFTLALICTAMWLLIFGVGIIRLGVAPGAEEVGRGLLFLLATVFYGGIWLALALVFSVRFRQTATAALASIAVWLFFTVFWSTIASLLAQTLSPVKVGYAQEIIAQYNLQLGLSRLSPNDLYAEVIVAMLQPQVRSLGLVLPTQLEGAILGSPLPLSQSILLVWPQMTGLIAGTILLFALAYVLFQRQEIRA